MDQAAELSRLLPLLSDLTDDILLYSGYTLEEMHERKEPYTDLVLHHLSVLIDGDYQEALNALNGMPETSRGARWYYYAGMASQGVGDNVRAMQYAQQATDLEPDNQTYASFLQRLRNGGTFYAQRNQNYGFGMGGQNGSLCLSLCMANALCMLCGGRWMFCM